MGAEGFLIQVVDLYRSVLAIELTKIIIAMFYFLWALDRIYILYRKPEGIPQNKNKGITFKIKFVADAAIILSVPMFVFEVFDLFSQVSKEKGLAASFLSIGSIVLSLCVAALIFYSAWLLFVRHDSSIARITFTQKIVNLKNAYRKSGVRFSHAFTAPLTVIFVIFSDCIFSFFTDVLS